MIEVCGYNLLKAEGRCCEAYCPKDLFSGLAFATGITILMQPGSLLSDMAMPPKVFRPWRARDYTLKLRKIGTRLMFRIGGVHKGTRRRK